MSHQNSSFQNFSHFLLYRLNVLTYQSHDTFTVNPTVKTVHLKYVRGDKANQCLVLTLFYVFRSDAANFSPVVCDLLCGFDVFIINAFAEPVDQRDSRHDAVHSVKADAHHLAVHSNSTGDPEITTTTKVISSHHRDDDSKRFINVLSPFKRVFFYECFFCAIWVAFQYSVTFPYDVCSLGPQRSLDVIKVHVIKPDIRPVEKTEG